MRAEDLISRYGAVLESSSRTGAFGTFESALPASKQVIGQAIKEEMLHLAMAGQLNAELADRLAVGYMYLATFVPDEDARALLDLARSTRNGAPGDLQAVIARLPMMDRAQPVIQRIVQAQEELLNDINEWEQKVRSLALERAHASASSSLRPEAPKTSLWSRLFG